jgi:hypothetical protein
MPLCTTPTLLTGVLHTNVPGEPPSGQDLLHELTAGRPSLAGTRDHSGITDSRRWTGSPRYVADSSSLRRIRGGPGRYDPDHHGPSPVGLQTARQGVRFPPGAPSGTAVEHRPTGVGRREGSLHGSGLAPRPLVLGGVPSAGPQVRASSHCRSVPLVGPAQPGPWLAPVLHHRRPPAARPCAP